MTPAQSIRRIALVTDFGPGVYLGQMTAVLRDGLASGGCGIEVIDLVHDLPPFRPDLAAHLLPAMMRDMPPGTLYLCVVDPGVGGERALLLVESGGDWLIGPDNGLLTRVVARASESDAGARVWRIGWAPECASASFHGRDWMAPAAVRLCRGEPLDLTPLAPAQMQGADAPDELAAVIYADRYGNLMTGLRAERAPGGGVIEAGGRTLMRARTFGDCAPGTAFWYENALGLVELAVNQGRADLVLGLRPGDVVGRPRAAGEDSDV